MTSTIQIFHQKTQATPTLFQTVIFLFRSFLISQFLNSCCSAFFRREHLTVEFPCSLRCFRLGRKKVIMQNYLRDVCSFLEAKIKRQIPLIIPNGSGVWEGQIQCRNLYINSKMDKGKPSKFFKAFMNNAHYKVFLDDVAVIYKMAPRPTPRLQPYQEASKQIGDDTDESMVAQSGA